MDDESREAEGVKALEAQPLQGGGFPAGGLELREGGAAAGQQNDAVGESVYLEGQELEAVAAGLPDEEDGGPFEVLFRCYANLSHFN